jgi:hypothetical protein
MLYLYKLHVHSLFKTVPLDKEWNSHRQKNGLSSLPRLPRSHPSESVIAGSSVTGTKWHLPRTASHSADVN